MPLVFQTKVFRPFFKLQKLVFVAIHEKFFERVSSTVNDSFVKLKKVIKLCLIIYSAIIAWQRNDELDVVCVQFLKSVVLVITLVGYENSVPVFYL